MQTCSKCHAQSPDTVKHCISCDANLDEWSETSRALKRLRDNPRVIYVRISVSDDCCPACWQAEGAYAKQSAPKLPIDGCSHESGCRCFYQPVLDSIYP